MSERVAVPALKRLRSDAGLSQLALALEASVAPTTIALLEVGKQRTVNYSAALRLAVALGVPIEALLQSF